MLIDLVLVKHKGNPKYFLFQAPAFSRLRKGSLVVVDTKVGEIEAEVVNVITLTEGRSEFKFIVDMANATLPLRRVLKEIAYRELHYGLEEECDGER